MADANATDSPLEAMTDVAGTGANEVFKVLANEERLAILLALWEAYEPFAEGIWDPTEGNDVAFSDLRDRVGMPDSGQFNYHLGKLEGQFVEQSPDGYRLRPAGQKIVRALIANASFQEVTTEPTEIDLACSECGGQAAITYQNQRLYRVCTECEGSSLLGEKHPSGVTGAWASFNPVSLSQRTPEEAYIAWESEMYYHKGMETAGICPYCSGQLETRLHVCDAHDPESDAPCPVCGRAYELAVRFVCTVCKHGGVTPLASLSRHHPAVIGFFWDHGIKLPPSSLETIKFFNNNEEVRDEDIVSREPPRARVTFHLEGDEIQLTHDEAVNVVEINESD